MFWASISVYGTSRLLIIEGTTNQVEYVPLLEGQLLRPVRQLRPVSWQQLHLSPEWCPLPYWKDPNEMVQGEQN